MTMKPSEILDKAAEVAEKLDHCKGVLRHVDMKGEPVACCTNGAVFLVVGKETWEDGDAGEVNETLTFIRDSLPSPANKDRRIPWGVVNWNDHKDTTKEDVVALLRRAAEAARAAGR